MSSAERADRVHFQLLEEGSVLHALLDHPKGNVLTLAMMGDLGAALATHRDDRDLKLVLLQGAGGQLSYGNSVIEHQREQVPAMLAGFHELVRTVARYPVPVAALLEGRALGGPFELALAGHFLLGTPGLLAGAPEVRLGVFAPVLSAMGPLRLGTPLAEKLMLTGGLVSAAELQAAGALSALLDGEPLAAALDWFRRELAPLSAFALRQATRAARASAAWRQALDEQLPAAERQYLTEVVASRDGNEGISAFLERRPPRWVNA